MTAAIEAAGSPLQWLEQAERSGASVAAALAMFDRMAPVAIDTLRGRWHGGGLHTGHALDGMLESFGWYGKAFIDEDTVAPLLFRAGDDVVSLDPRWLPVGLAARLRPQRWRGSRIVFSLLRRALATTRPTARLRAQQFRGVTTAAMIYDRQPIIDLFREAAPGVLLGLMDLRGHPPMFFTLRRERADAVAG